MMPLVLHGLVWVLFSHSVALCQATASDVCYKQVRMILGL
jgi:hypothetical protein